MSDYGLPLRIRSDYGVENVRVWDYMIQRRQNTNAIILGSFVHNQRIERFNRDVNYQVVNHFFNQFMHLEDINMLDPMNENDLFCLHLTYLPEINKGPNLGMHITIMLVHLNVISPLDNCFSSIAHCCSYILDSAGTINLQNISGNNHIRVPTISLPSWSVLESLHAVIARNAHCDTQSLYIACRTHMRIATALLPQDF